MINIIVDKVKGLLLKDETKIDNLGKWLAITLKNRNKKVIITTVYRIPITLDQEVYMLVV